MKLLSFRLWGELFAVNITSVKEINRQITCTPTPTAHPFIIGLYNMRGQTVTVFDLPSMLGYAPLDQSKPITCVILKTRKDMPDIVGFAVDTTEDVLLINESLCSNPPANVDEEVKEKLLGVYELENDLLLIIDEDKLFFSDRNLKSV